MREESRLTGRMAKEIRLSIGMFGVAALLTRTRLAPTQRGK
jgi:hypothetical protein